MLAINERSQKKVYQFSGVDISLVNNCTTRWGIEVRTLRVLEKCLAAFRVCVCVCACVYVCVRVCVRVGVCASVPVSVYKPRRAAKGKLDGKSIPKPLKTVLRGF